MRRALTAGVLAGVALVPLLAGSASADPGLVHVRNDESGIGVGVGPEYSPIAGAGVNYSGPTVCVGIGLWTACTPVVS